MWLCREKISSQRLVFPKVILLVSIFVLCSVGSGFAQVSDSTGALTITPLAPTADCQGILANVVLDPSKISTFLFVPLQSFLTITGDLLFPPSPVSRIGFGGEVIYQIVAVKAGQFVSVTVTVVGCFLIGPFCFSTTLSTGLVYTAPEAPCGCQGLEVEAFEQVLPIHPGVVPDSASTTITASVSDPAPAGGCKVTFSPPDPIVASGGHVHDGNRPHGTLNPTSCTIQEGMTLCTVQYTASEISGEEVIVGTLPATGERANGTVTIRVRDLEELTDSAIDSWRLTGSTGKHPDNHYGTVETNAAIRGMAMDYYNNFGESIGINDMSLIWGGLFDIAGNWAPPHNSHRAGKSVDIDRCAQSLVKQDALDGFAKKRSGIRVVETPKEEPPCEGPENTPLIHYDFP